MIYLCKSLAAYLTGNKNKTLEYVNKISDSLIGEKHCVKALYYYGIGHIDQAMEEFLMVTNIEKSSKRSKATSYYNMGCIYSSKNQITLAQNMFERAEEIAKDNFQDIYNKARDAKIKISKLHANWYDWWFSEGLNTFDQGMDWDTKISKENNLLTRSVLRSRKIFSQFKRGIKRALRSNTKPFFGGLVLVGIIVPIIAILTNLVITLVFQKTNVSVEIFTFAAIILGICTTILLSPVFSKLKFVVIELEVETPTVQLDNLDLDFEFLKTSMTLEYPLTSFKATLQQPLSIPLRDQLKPLTIPTIYYPYLTLIED